MAKTTPKRGSSTASRSRKAASKPSSIPKTRSSSIKTPTKNTPKPADRTKAAKPAAKAPAKAASKATSKVEAKPAVKPASKPVGKAVAPAKGQQPSKPVVAAATAKSGSKGAPAVPAAVAPAVIPAPTGSLAAAAALAAGKAKPKGITIVTPRPMRKPKVKKNLEMPSLGAPLLGPGSKKIKPLIPSGPNVRPVTVLGGGKPEDARNKSSMSAKDVGRYREVLMRKRSELVGDVAKLETEALGGSGGSQNSVPQNVPEEGTETFDQSLSLDLAQVDRNLIREIDDALTRIERGTFGVCEMTGKPISKERLEELPWTRFSIEAARERERRAYFRVGAPPAQSV